MKLNLITTAAVLAMTSATLAVPAKAQFVGTSEDLILSFANNARGATGGTTNYEIDLGQYSTYANATGSINIANVNADLSSVYGSNYFSNSSLSLAITGVNNSGTTSNGVKNQSAFVSNTTTTPYATLAASALAQPVSNYANIYKPAADVSNLPVAGSTIGSYKVPIANVNSFNIAYSNANFPNEVATFGTGSAPQLNLDILQPGTSAFVKGTSTILANGFFDVTSTGELQFLLNSSGQVPEPSTYALMLIGGGILVGYLRRKKVSSL